jgi:hypothetical protein
MKCGCLTRRLPTPCYDLYFIAFSGKAFLAILRQGFKISPRMVSMGTLAVRYIWLSGKPRSVDRHGPDIQYILFIQIAILYVKAQERYSKPHVIEKKKSARAAPKVS